MVKEYSRRNTLQVGGTVLTLSLSGCVAFTGESRQQSNSKSSIPIFIYNLDSSPHEVFIQISGSSSEHNYKKTHTIPSGTIDKATEVGTDDFYLTARVENLQNGKDATGPSRGESDFSEDGYLVVVHDETAERKRVEIKPLNPGETSTTTQ